jgi:hypothetical protein
MRKIELEMCNAIRSEKNWSKANTKVEIVNYMDAAGDAAVKANVYLHNNHIATIAREVVEITDAGWQSSTTKTRLNSILYTFTNNRGHVYQRDFRWYIARGVGQDTDGGYTREMDRHQWYAVSR